MPKSKTQYVCQSCGSHTSRWSGKCDACGEWNTLTEEIVSAPAKNQRGARSAGGSEPRRITEVDSLNDERLSTGLREMDRVLGGGIVPGSMILLGGDPGIGKSTLMMQMCRPREGVDTTILYVSGEESLRQIKLRADRLNALSDSFLVLAETDLDAILSAITRIAPDVVIIDSIQTMCRAELESAPGSI